MADEHEEDDIAEVHKPVGIMKSIVIMWGLGIVTGVLLHRWFVTGEGDAMLVVLVVALVVSLVWYARTAYRTSRAQDLVTALVMEVYNMEEGGLVRK